MYTFLSFQPLASGNVYWFEIILFYEHYHGAKLLAATFLKKITVTSATLPFIFPQVDRLL